MKALPTIIGLFLAVIGTMALIGGSVSWTILVWIFVAALFALGISGLIDAFRTSETVDPG